MGGKPRVEDVVARIESLARPEAVEGMARFGTAGRKVYGVPIPDLREMARGLKRDHELARDLWAVDSRETRILAGMIDDPKMVSPEQMDQWVMEFDSEAVQSKLRGSRCAARRRTEAETMASGYALAFASAAFIGLNTVANKVILSSGVSDMVAGAWTYLFATCLFIPLAARATTRGALGSLLKSADRRTTLLLAAWLLAGGAGGPMLYFLGLSRTSAIHGSLLNNLEAAFTALLAFGMFHEGIGPRGIAGSVIVLAGSAWLSWPAGAAAAGAGAGGATVLGDALISLGFFCWALECNLLRVIGPRLPVVTMLAAKTTTAMLVMGALALSQNGSLAIPRGVVPVTVASGLVFLALSILFGYSAIRRIGAGLTGLIITTSVIFGVLGSVVFLGESLHLSMLAPGAAIILGLAALATDPATGASLPPRTTPRDDTERSCS